VLFWSIGFKCHRHGLRLRRKIKTLYELSFENQQHRLNLFMNLSLPYRKISFQVSEHTGASLHSGQHVTVVMRTLGTSKDVNLSVTHSEGFASKKQPWPCDMLEIAAIHTTVLMIERPGVRQPEAPGWRGAIDLSATPGCQFPAP